MPQENKSLQNKIKNLPNTPGVYIMRDTLDTVIYVGKARVLKNRVRQYFSNENQLPKVAAMISKIADFEYIITDTELEALVLECNLIKKYRPHYNILLKDNKQFPYIRIDLSQDFPLVEVVRNVSNDNAKYFGPFIAAHVIRDVLDNIYRLYPLRSCKKDIASAIRRNERPCLNYEMGRCIGPCTGKVSKEEYMALVQDVISVISGDKISFKNELVRQMNEAAQNLEFEQAASLRDKINLIERIREKQKAGFPNLNDKDVFAVETGKDFAIVQSFLFRDGKLNYAKKYELQYDNQEKEDIMEGFLQQYYIDKTGIPKQIFVLPKPADCSLLTEWLSEKKGSKVEILQAQRGDNKKLLNLAQKNAKDAIKIKEGTQKLRELATENLAKTIGLNIPLKRIECYDISNTQGTDNVASMVVFTDGKPNKKQYRRFKIKGFQGANDFASLNEALTRRLLRGLSSDAGFSEMPDLIIIDGGKGQLSSAIDALFSVGCESIPIISLAKKQEEIFLPNATESILMPVGSPQYRLVTNIRDEAHRFAITFHRQLREKRIHKSELSEIEGVVEIRRKQIMKHFGSLKKVKEASLQDLEEVKGLPKDVAKKIYLYFENKNSLSS